MKPCLPCVPPGLHSRARRAFSAQASAAPAAPTPTRTTQTPPAAAAAYLATAQIDSNTVGADIEIDGAFAGNTLSTLSVPAGQHTITVKKKNYPDWTRTLNVSGTTSTSTPT